MKKLIEIGKRIRALREKRDLSQDDLARSVGYTSRSSINKIEKGIVDLPLSKIELIAHALNTNVSYLMWGEEKKTKSEDFPIYTQPKTELLLSSHEIELIKSYRARPEMQSAIDKLLELQKDELPTIKRQKSHCISK